MKIIILSLFAILTSSFYNFDISKFSSLLVKTHNSDTITHNKNKVYDNCEICSKAVNDFYQKDIAEMQSNVGNLNYNTQKKAAITSYCLAKCLKERCYNYCKSSFDINQFNNAMSNLEQVLRDKNYGIPNCNCSNIIISNLSSNNNQIQNQNSQLQNNTNNLNNTSSDHGYLNNSTSNSNRNTKISTTDLNADIEEIKKSKTEAEAKAKAKEDPKKNEEEEFNAKLIEKKMEFQGYKNSNQASVTMKTRSADNNVGSSECTFSSVETQSDIGIQKKSAEICEYSLNKKGYWTVWKDIGNNLQFSYCPELVILPPATIGDRIIKINDYGYYRFKNLNDKSIAISGKLEIKYVDENRDEKTVNERVFFDSNEKEISQEIGMWYLGYEIISITWLELKCYKK